MILVLLSLPRLIVSNLQSRRTKRNQTMVLNIHFNIPLGLLLFSCIPIAISFRNFLLSFPLLPPLPCVSNSMSCLVPNMQFASCYPSKDALPLTSPPLYCHSPSLVYMYFSIHGMYEFAVTTVPLAQLLLLLILFAHLCGWTLKNITFDGLA